MCSVSSRYNAGGPFISFTNYAISIWFVKFYCSSVHVGRREEHKTRPSLWYLSVHVLSTSVMSNSLWSHGPQPAKLLQGECIHAKLLSCVQLFVTLWTVAHQAPLSMGFSRQEYWIGLPCPSPGDLPDSGIELGSPALQADFLPSEPPGKHN